MRGGATAASLRGSSGCWRTRRLGPAQRASGDLGERRRAVGACLLALLLAEALAQLLEHALHGVAVGHAPARLVPEQVLEGRRAEAVVEQLEVPGAHERGVRDAAGTGQR